MLLCTGSFGTLAAQEKHALLVGVEQYQDSDRISTLNSADDDAHALASVLFEVCGFKKQNVRVLASDAATKPTKRNVLFEVGELAKRVRRRDTVVFWFSGHGLLAEIGGQLVSCLVPWDADLRNAATMRASLLSADDVRAELQRVSAGWLFVAFDMCRNLPEKSLARSADARNSLSDRLARDLVVVPGQSGTGPANVAVLFSCSPTERSWESRSLRRGYFSWAVEQGLRGGAADADGAVRLGALAKFVAERVPSVVAREVGEAQTPLIQTAGASAGAMVLATGVAAPKPATGPSAGFDAAFDEAVASARSRRFVAALVSLEQARRIRPSEPKVYDWLGRTLVSMGMRSHGRAALRKAAEMDLASPSAQNQLGLLSVMEQAAPDIQERDFRASLRIDPNYVPALGNLAQVLMQRREFDEAGGLLRRALELDPNSPFNHDAMASFLRAVRDDLDGAERHHRMAVALAPERALFLMNLASFLQVARGDLAGAEELLRRATRLEPGSAAASSALGVFLYSFRSAYSEAEAMFRRAAAIAPNAGIYRANLAMALVKVGKRAEAMEAARRAVELGYKGPHPVFDELGIKP